MSSLAFCIMAQLKNYTFTIDTDTQSQNDQNIAILSQIYRIITVKRWMALLRYHL